MQFKTTSEIKLNQVKINDQFWSPYRQLVRTEMIPFQWNVLNDLANITIEKERNDDYIPSEKSHAIENFKIAAGKTSGHHYGWVFQDSDVYKWLEAVAYSLEEVFDPELKQLADSVVELIAAAQEEDGYLCTYFTIEEPERRFKKLAESHELYCAGHYIEAAVAYYRSAQNTKALEVACKLADCIDRHFGPETGKIQGYDGHEEIELALTKLYEVTNEVKYLELSRFFLYERGKDTTFFMRQSAEDTGKRAVIEGMSHRPLSYYQAHKPVLEMENAEGHAVRLVYLCTAMADVARLKKDEKLLSACRRLWKSIVSKRMYITGGIGSTVDGEAFTSDYDLPNDTMYCETCASIGLIFFALNMLKNEAKGEYADIMERALYNTAISGMALDGKHFFYVNPLEVKPENSQNDPGKSHVKIQRPAWFGCACCPPNLARLLTSLEKYIYTIQGRTIYTNLYMTSETKLELDEHTVTLHQATNYPREGEIVLKTSTSAPVEFTLAVRIPSWSQSYTLTVNGHPFEHEVEYGYAAIHRVWQDQDEVELMLDMRIAEWSAHPLVRSDRNKIAIQRGPFVYCAEEADNGAELHLLRIPRNRQYTYEYNPDQWGGIGIIRTMGEKLDVTPAWDGVLYAQQGNDKFIPQEITLIPYYCWANRKPGEMSVWLYKE